MTGDSPFGTEPSATAARCCDDRLQPGCGDPGASVSVRHPLTILRLGLALSHADYSRLVARTHLELGHGHMAARREKVSRWESGRVVPERSAQLAIARIHSVPTAEVGFPCWPFWLYPYSRLVLMTTWPWRCGDVVDTFRGPGPGRGLGPAHQSSLAVAGSGLRNFLLYAMAALADRSKPREPPTASSVRDVLEGRVSDLEGMHREAMGFGLEAAVAGEFGFLTEILAGSGNDGVTQSAILALLVRVAVVGGAVHQERSQFTAAEEYLLLAVRAAVAIGSEPLAASCLTSLAALHERAGEFTGSRTLRAAVSAAFPRDAAAMSRL
ncbi:hypothetical protein ACFVVX_15085 [Kitasatospora sp. NPDC058170]|uniref:hypothetical protein n=1 Tax=Kitasatospora sp. NPDC058170 TaxID=3346364 RepID=UPI0036DDB91A